MQRECPRLRSWDETLPMKHKVSCGSKRIEKSVRRRIRTRDTQQRN